MANVSGNWNNGSNAGLFYLNSNYDSSNSNTNIGSRLIVFLIYFIYRCLIINLSKDTLPHGKKYFLKRHGLVTYVNGREEKNKVIYVPKRIGNLFNKMCEIENIKIAIFDSARGKKKRKSVKKVLENVDNYAYKIQQMLLNKSYKPSSYHTFEQYDSHCKKVRAICSTAYYPDQIIFWCVINTIRPVIMRGMYEWCCGSVSDRGIKYGYRAVKRWLNCDWKNTKYCLKLDIHHFYQSISHEKLIAMFEHKIKDKQMLRLIATIINSYSTGLPIGNYTSQWFANFYLESLDHYIKQNLHIKRYVRYVDDMVLFSHSKKQLHKAYNAISIYLDKVGLQLKDNYQIFPTKNRTIDFLGYQFYRNHIKLRKSDFLLLSRQYRKICRKINKHESISFKMAAGFMSRYGQLKHCNAYFLKQKFGKHLNLLKEVIRGESKRKRTTRCIII